MQSVAFLDSSHQHGALALHASEFLSKYTLAAMPNTIKDSIVEHVENNREGAHIDPENKMEPKKLSGPLLVATITSVCSSGFLLFGYDQGHPQPASISFPSRY